MHCVVSVHTVYAVMLCNGAVDWLCAVVLCINAVMDWVCAVMLCNDTVD